MRRWGLVLTCAVAVGVLAPIAWASHLFSDVPDSNPFHDDISAIYGAGITSGKTCDPPGTPPTYCPAEVITREAMAAYVHRGFGRVAASVRSSSIPALTPTPQEVASVSLAVGGVAGHTQFVKLMGAVDAFVDPGGPITGCPCNVRYYITQDGVGQVGLTHHLTNPGEGPSTGNEYAAVSSPVSAVVAVPTATTQTFRLMVALEGSEAPDPFIYAAPLSDLTAITVPFGPTGVAVLSEGGASG